jgi:RNA polymerase primary sigma factor
MLTLPSMQTKLRVDKKTERKLLIRASRGDKEAREMLVLANQGLVVLVASKYKWAVTTGYTFEDLVQEGNIGLMMAIDRFNIKKRVRLSTYAMLWIKQKIYRALAERGRLVHIPTSVQCKFFKTVDALKKNPDAKIPKKDLNGLKVLGFKVESDSFLSPPIANIEDVHVARKAYNHNTELEKRLNVLDFEKLLTSSTRLKEIHKKIIAYRVGLYDGETKTFDEIDKILGLVHGETSRKFEKALRILKTILMENAHEPAARSLDSFFTVRTNSRRAQDRPPVGEGGGAST